MTRRSFFRTVSALVCVGPLAKFAPPRETSATFGYVGRMTWQFWWNNPKSHYDNLTTTFDDIWRSR